MSAVERVDVSVYRLPTDGPESDATLTWTSTTVVAVQVRCEGFIGLGFTYHSAAAADLVATSLTPVVIGADPIDPPRCWQAMVKAVRNYGRPGIASAAIAAVDVALWDLKAKMFDVAVVSLLGSNTDTVPVYTSGGFTSYSTEDLVTQLSRWVHQDGFPRVKMKVGTDWGAVPERDIERVAKARLAIGDQAALFVDANGGYRTKQAVRVARAFADCGVTWFEEPVSSDDLDGLRAVRDAIDLDVAAGEYGSDLVYFQRMCAAGAVDVLQADVSRCAGITEWVRVAAVAAAHGMPISGHCAQSLHVHPACAVANLRHLEYFVDHARVDRALFDGVLEPADGALRPDRTRPGHGLALRSDAAEQYRVR